MFLHNYCMLIVKPWGLGTKKKTVISRKKAIHLTKLRFYTRGDKKEPHGAEKWLRDWGGATLHSKDTKYPLHSTLNKMYGVTQECLCQHINPCSKYYDEYFHWNRIIPSRNRSLIISLPFSRFIKIEIFMKFRTTHVNISFKKQNNCK